MPETVYLTQWIKDMLTDMVFSDREQTNLLLGDRISPIEIYVTNATVPFKGEATTVSLESIPGFKSIFGAVLDANRIYREKGLTWDRFVLFSSHSHPKMLGKIVHPGEEAWSVDDIPPKYEASRGRVIREKDQDGNLLYFSLKPVSDGKGGDDIYFKMTADKWRIIEYQFFVRPPAHLVGKPMTREVALDCYRYDPEMILGKIRKIPISEQVLTREQLMKTILDPGKSLYYVEEQSRRVVLPYRKRK